MKTSPAVSSRPDPSRLEGVVQRVLPERGYGFIRVRDGQHAGVDFFFHISGLVDCRINDLVEGTLVHFTMRNSAKGPRAEQIECVELP